MTQLVLEEILDTSTLKQYVEVIGYEKFLQSVTLFESLVPQYLQQLKTYNDQGDVVKLCQQAHQLKGAAGSIGLLRIQNYAQQIQQSDHPSWNTDHVVWVEKMMKNTPHDLKILKAYLKEKLHK